MRSAQGARGREDPENACVDVVLWFFPALPFIIVPLHCAS